MGSNEGNRERDRHTLTMLQLLVAQHRKTSSIRAKWQLSWIALSSHTSNLLRLFPNTTTGGAYPGWGVVRVFDLGFRGVWVIPSGSWYSNMRKRTATGSGYLNLFRIERTVGSGYFNRLGTEQPLVRVLKTLGSKGLAVLGVSKTSWFRVFEHVQNRRTVGSGN